MENADYLLLSLIIMFLGGHIAYHMEYARSLEIENVHTERQLALLTHHLMALGGCDDPAHIRICAQLIMSLAGRTLTCRAISVQQEDRLCLVLADAINLLQRPVK